MSFKTSLFGQLLIAQGLKILGGVASAVTDGDPSTKGKDALKAGLQELTGGELEENLEAKVIDKLVPDDKFGPDAKTIEAHFDKAGDEFQAALMLIYKHVK